MQNIVFSREDFHLTFVPYPNFKAILKLDGRFVKTHFRNIIEYTNTSPAMIEYVNHYLEIDNKVFHSINCTLIGRIRASHEVHRIIRTSQMMLRWLLVSYNWYKCNLCTNVCP